MLLRAVNIENVVVHERHLLGLVGVLEDELLAVVDSVQFGRVSCQLSAVEGPETTENFYVAFVFHD